MSEDQLSNFVEYQGVDQPSVVLVVSRRWDLKNEPWQILQMSPDRKVSETFTCADPNELMMQFCAILGMNLIATTPPTKQ